jgi:putative methyltransferase (TIGR04325 family)
LAPGRSFCRFFPFVPVLNDEASMNMALQTFMSPLVPRSLRQARAEHRFLDQHAFDGVYYGVFDDFEQARAYIAAHAHKPLYQLDHQQWLREHRKLRPHDYPILFWLGQLLGAGKVDAQPPRVFDLGGSLGVAYHAYRPYLPFPKGLIWQVGEFGDAVQQGSRLAEEQGETALRFTADLGALDHADVLLAAGSLLYIESPLHTLLRAAAAPPPHLLINKLPLSNTHEFITLENGGDAIYPCRVAKKADFLAQLSQLGYRLVDGWLCLEHNMTVALHPELSLRHYHGFYLRYEPTQH